MSVSAELGSIDQGETDRTFDRLQGSLQSCYRRGLERVDYLGGDAQFFVRVSQEGKARYAYLEESTLGDRETEQCMLQSVLRASWPKPQGGEAEVRKTMGFDPPGDVRPPAAWSPQRVTESLASVNDALQTCKAQAPGSKFTVTLYVEPGEGAGHVQAVGVATSSREGEGKIPCIVDALRSASMPSPGSYGAKVTFPL